MNWQYSVFGIGNAIVDIISEVDEKVFSSLGLVKGSMNLIDQDQSTLLLESISKDHIRSPGGSAANSMAGIASLGGNAAFAGKVAGDSLGKVFTNDMNLSGIDFLGSSSECSQPTGTSIILVTPDSQRTMNTHLGIANEFSSDDFDSDGLEASNIIFCELYLWDRPIAKKAIRRAISLVNKEAGQKISLSLSDTFCIERHHDEVFSLVEDSVDILFANEAELTTLFGASLEESMERLRDITDIACITLGAEGSIIISESETIKIPAIGGIDIVDTTGAGDQYAAGVLFGITNNYSLQEAGKIGSIAAGEVISHFGPRPETSLASLI